MVEKVQIPVITIPKITPLPTGFVYTSIDSNYITEVTGIHFFAARLYNIDAERVFLFRFFYIWVLRLVCTFVKFVENYYESEPGLV